MPRASRHALTEASFGFTTLVQQSTPSRGKVVGDCCGGCWCGLSSFIRRSNSHRRQGVTAPMISQSLWRRRGAPRKSSSPRFQTSTEGPATSSDATARGGHHMQCGRCAASVCQGRETRWAPCRCLEGTTTTLQHSRPPSTCCALECRDGVLRRTTIPPRSSASL